MLSLRIGTRRSPLALAQAKLVARALSRYCKKIELVEVSTSGDVIADVPLTEIGGKALFLKELEEKLLANEIDVAVHSMKDVPALYHPELEVLPVLKRACPNDIFLSFCYTNMASMPDGAVVGTCAPRRIIQLDKRFKVVPLRGNIGTRIEKARSCDGIILAFCGLEKLNLHHLVSEFLDESVILPGVGQGTLCVELKKGNHLLREVILKISDRETVICTEAERAFLEEINGDCKTAVGALAVIRGGSLHFRGMLGKCDRPFYVKSSGLLSNARQIGSNAALKLLHM